MTKDAQFALRRGEALPLQHQVLKSLSTMSLVRMTCAVIEKYTRNARFCLICNYVSKIIPALQSRCTRFRFPPLGEEHVRDRLQHVIDAERYGMIEQQVTYKTCAHGAALRAFVFPALFLAIIPEHPKPTQRRNILDSHQCDTSNLDLVASHFV